MLMSSSNPSMNASWLARVLLILSAALLLRVELAAQNVKVTATARPQMVVVNEVVEFIVTVEGGAVQRNISVPPSGDYIVTGTGRSSEYSSVNGVITSKDHHTFQVRPIKKGKVQLPAVEVWVYGKRYFTTPVLLDVIDEPEVTNAPTPGTPAFVRLLVNKTNVYVGEVFLVEVQLYVLSGQDAQYPQLDSEGFVLGTMQQPLQHSVVLGQYPYQMLSFKSSVHAVKAGELQLGPATCNLNIVVGRVNIFGIGQLRPTTLKSNPIKMNVLPLPTRDVPPSFTGAVGRFQLSWSATPTNVVVGDPVTLSIRITGDGPLETIQLPPQLGWEDFRVYAAKATLEDTDALKVSGTKRFEQIVTPLKEGSTHLPPLEFAYFDPELKRYQVERGSPIQLKVTAPGSAAAAPNPQLPGVAPDTQPAEVQIFALKPHLGAVGPLSSPLLSRPWFWILAAVPVLLFASVVARTKWNERNKAGATRFDRQRFQQELNQHLNSVVQAQQAGNVAEVYSLGFRALQLELGALLQRPAMSITAAIAEEELPRRGVSPELLHQVQDLFQQCDEARFSLNQSPGTQEEFVTQLRSTLAQLPTEVRP
jgi:hypothetical protein